MEVFNRLRPFDLRDNGNVRMELSEVRTGCFHFGGAADEGKGDVVDAVFNAEPGKAQVVTGRVASREVDSRKVYALALTDLIPVYHLAVDVAIAGGHDFQLYASVIDQYPVSRFHVFGEVRVVCGYEPGSAKYATARYRDSVARLYDHRMSFFRWARADLRARKVLKDCYVAASLFFQPPDQADAALVSGKGAVGEVQTEHCCAFANDLLESGQAARRWTNCGDDLDPIAQARFPHDDEGSVSEVRTC